MNRSTQKVVLTTLLMATLSLPVWAREKTVYENLGGKPTIVALVDEFVARVAADSRINRYFKATASDPARMADFKGKLVDQFCEAAGGPCKYLGKDMRTAHEGMGITEADFNALVEDLVGALDKFKTSEQDKKKLLAVFSQMEPYITGKR